MSLIKDYLFCLTLILIINILYFHYFDLLLLSWKSFAGFLNCVSYQLAIYILLRKLNINISGIFLVFLILCYALSSFGKYNWGEIPNYLLLKNTILNDIEILAKFKSKVFFGSLFLFVLLSIIFYLNKLADRNYVQNRKNDNKLIIILLCISVGCITFIEVRNQKASKYFIRDVLEQDPLVGVFVKNSKYSGDRPISHARMVNYNINLLKKRNSENVNVIIIVSDALRPDHMSLFGYKRKTTKYLDSLKLCENNMQLSKLSTSSCTSSFCGITSLLYGMNFENIPLNKSGIHDILKSHGYTTSFLLSGCHKCYYGLGDFYGKKIDNYFETRFNKSLDKSLSIYDDIGIVKFLNTLEFQPEKPNFMYIHIMAPHLGAVMSKTNAGPFFYETDQYNGLVTEYDNGIVQSDYILNELFKVLKTKGIYDNSLIIITADHGEGLKENKLFNFSGHGHLPYDEALNIPLIILDPKKIEYNLEYTTHIDIVPTILDRLFENFEAVNEVFEGKSLYNPKIKDRYTFHLDKKSNSLIPSIAIIKQVKNQPVYKYLYDARKNKRYIFDLKNSNYDNIIVNDSLLLKEFIDQHDKYLNQYLNFQNH